MLQIPSQVDFSIRSEMFTCFIGSCFLLSSIFFAHLEFSSFKDCHMTKYLAVFVSFIVRVSSLIAFVYLNFGTVSSFRWISLQHKVPPWHKGSGMLHRFGSLLCLWVGIYMFIFTVFLIVVSVQIHNIHLIPFVH